MTNGYVDLRLGPSHLTIVLALLHALERGDPHKPFHGWLSRAELHRAYARVFSDIRPDGIPRLVSRLNAAATAAFRRRPDATAPWPALVRTDHAYRLAVPGIRRVGRLADVRLDDPVLLRRLLRPPRVHAPVRILTPPPGKSSARSDGTEPGAASLRAPPARPGHW